MEAHGESTGQGEWYVPLASRKVIKFDADGEEIKGMLFVHECGSTVRLHVVFESWV